MVTPVPTSPVVAEVVPVTVCETLEAVMVAAAVCEPQGAKEVTVAVEEALGAGAVTVATWEPLGAWKSAAVSSFATTRRIVPPVENTVISNLATCINVLKVCP